VLEKRAERPPQSKAMTVYPRTLEMLATRGLDGRVPRRGGTPVPSSYFTIAQRRQTLQHITASPSKIGKITQAAPALVLFEHKML
jgi:hypothetical protein